jgi:hypothetical protein
MLGDSGSHPESGRAIHRAEDLVGDSCARTEKIGLIGVNSLDNTAIKGDLHEKALNLQGVVTGSPPVLSISLSDHK